MAITNMDNLFDKLQDYIDKKIVGVESGLKDLFDEYEVKKIIPHLEEIGIVASGIDYVFVVGDNIDAVVDVHDNMDKIDAIPSQIALQEQLVAEGKDYYDDTVISSQNSFKWSSEELNIPVDDGSHTGYSSYHWSKTAEATVYQLTLIGEWNPNDGIYPTPTSHGDYWLVNADGSFDSDTWYAGDSLIWVDDGTTQEWVHKQESVHWLQIVGKPNMYTPKPHYHSEYVQLDNLLVASNGPASAGYPIKLGLNGLIHNSMIKLPVMHIVGSFTPVFNLEYPDVTNELSGASWMVTEVHVNDGYRFSTGELASRVVRNGDFMIWTDDGWIIQYDKLMPSTYLKRSGEYSMFGDLDMAQHKVVNLADGVDVQDAVNVRQIQSLTDDLFLKNEFITTSTGIADSGKPIVLNQYGLVDQSMISFNALITIGDWNPEGGDEYPTMPDIEPGYAWRIEGTGTDGYTFTSGDLNGRYCEDGDWIIYGQSGWILNPIKIVPEDYYRIDGTNPLSAEFNGGGYRVTNIDDGIDAKDGVTMYQLTDGLQGKSEANHTHTPQDISPQGSGSGLNAEYLDGHVYADFAISTHTHNVGDITGQGHTTDGSGFDADMLDGKHADEFMSVGSGISWDDITSKPATYNPPYSTKSTNGGARIWMENDVLYIETIAP